MTAKRNEIKLKAIGTVRSDLKESTRQKHEDSVTEIVIDKGLTEALDGLEQFSHIIVIWWVHKSRRPFPMKVHPRGNPNKKLMGVFASRSPDRPNPIGKSTVRLLERRGNVLKVRGLDAIDGTPVLDIKPYIPGYDSAEDATAPPWTMKKIGEILQDIYRRLLARYSPQHWWPAQEPFEVITGAILTQSTAWTNVEKAIANLKAAGKLTPEGLRQLSDKELAGLIRPCGYYNVKARRLKAFVSRLGERYDDDLDRLFNNDIEDLRKELLDIYGIGEETADSIMLYTGNKTVFVVDAYTRRIVDRMGLKPETRSYASYQKLFTANLPADSGLFNEYHALLVRHAKEVCRKSPLCQHCCLNGGKAISQKKAGGEYPCRQRYK